nr:hypothetical protein [Tanacetum cinerariifolium]
NVPTASARIANISQDTACAYIASQSIGSQIKFEDINQIDEDDMEEMDIKWNMALPSMRADKFWKKTGQKNSIQAQQKKKMMKKKSSSENEPCCSKACKKNTDNLSSKITELSDKLNDKDLSWTGFPEFADDTVTDYSRPSPTIEGSLDDAQNKNPSTETGASDSIILSKPAIKFMKAADKATERPKIDKVKTTKKHVVKYAELHRKPSKKPTVRGNQRNWNNLKS